MTALRRFVIDAQGYETRSRRGSATEVEETSRVDRLRRTVGLERVVRTS